MVRCVTSGWAMPALSLPHVGVAAKIFSCKPLIGIVCVMYPYPFEMNISDSTIALTVGTKQWLAKTCRQDCA